MPWCVLLCTQHRCACRSPNMTLKEAAFALAASLLRQLEATARAEAVWEDVNQNSEASLSASAMSAGGLAAQPATVGAATIDRGPAPAPAPAFLTLSRSDEDDEEAGGSGVIDDSDSDVMLLSPSHFQPDSPATGRGRDASPPRRFRFTGTTSPSSASRSGGAGGGGSSSRAAVPSSKSPQGASPGAALRALRCALAVVPEQRLAELIAMRARREHHTHVVSESGGAVLSFANICVCRCLTCCVVPCFAPDPFCILTMSDGAYGGGATRPEAGC